MSALFGFYILNPLNLPFVDCDYHDLYSEGPLVDKISVIVYNHWFPILHYPLLCETLKIINVSKWYLKQVS